MSETRYRWLTGPYLSILYGPVLLIVTVLWYKVFAHAFAWTREKRYPPAMTRDIVYLVAFMAITPGVWQGSLHGIWGIAVLAVFMTHGRRTAVVGKDESKMYVALSPALRLRYCDRHSVAWSGVAAGLVTTFVLYVYILRRFVQLTDWSLAAKANALLIYTVLGSAAGLLRQKIRARWPEAIETGFAFAGQSNFGFYVDEFVMPLVFSFLVWAGMGSIDAAFFHDILAWPFMIIFAIPIYALWAFCHTGMLGWLGTLGRQQFMESVAYEVLLSGDQTQRWLGGLDIVGDPIHNRYVLTGVLPNRPTLMVIERRLHDIQGAEVDSEAVRIDPLLAPDYRRLTALSRKGARPTRLH
jgi:hypothetical protein